MIELMLSWDFFLVSSYKMTTPLLSTVFLSYSFKYDAVRQFSGNMSFSFHKASHSLYCWAIFCFRQRMGGKLRIASDLWSVNVRGALRTKMGLLRLRCYKIYDESYFGSYLENWLKLFKKMIIHTFFFHSKASIL